jgi:hypothetical protein
LDGLRLLNLCTTVVIVAGSDDFGPDPDPTPEKNADPDPALCKILYQLFVTRNFCFKIAYKTYS